MWCGVCGACVRVVCLGGCNVCVCWGGGGRISARASASATAAAWERVCDARALRRAWQGVRREEHVAQPAPFHLAQRAWECMRRRVSSRSWACPPGTRARTADAPTCRLLLRWCPSCNGQTYPTYWPLQASRHLLGRGNPRALRTPPSQRLSRSRARQHTACALTCSHALPAHERPCLSVLGLDRRGGQSHLCG